ncbi:vWA domain-containing protein [Rubritalea profundi]|uniref:VWFA domain-containing protein n=1 Tax=Rubritalea profundi TaxID=1658618 RepID=A0A2S7U6B9_9BACT|nr:BatA and WFA domain-containing protein [Rubritalea profundi]PQJ29763.1 hypothetical protein BSZ32_15600 [Rubritalea profundi]
MNLLTPSFLWAFLALIPLGAVYFMKTKPRKRVTNALFLWQKILEEKSSHFAFKKMRNLWSLLLMLLVFALAAFSLTNPQWGEKQQTHDLLIIIDTSVSMRATQDGQSRFDIARDKVADWLKSVEGGSRVAIASIDKDLKYHCNLSSNTHELQAALKQLEPSQFPLSPQSLSELSMLEKSSDGTRGCRIILLSDLANPTDQMPDQIELVSIGEPTSDNIGITSVDMAPLPGQRAKLFFTLYSNAEEETELELELIEKSSGRIAKLITVNIPAKETLSEVIEIDDAQAGLWVLELRHDDSFTEDNRVVLGLSQPKAIGVSIAAANQYFYSRCINAFSAADNLLEILPEGKAEVHITESTALEKQGATLIFAPQEASPYWISATDEIEHVVVEKVVKNHPLTQHLKIDNLTFSGARNLTAPEGAIVILQDISGSPLLYEISDAGQKVVVANFQPSRDNFYLSPWFPIMVHNAARYLAGREADLPSVVRNGSTVRVPSQTADVIQHFHATDPENNIEVELPTMHSLQSIGGYSYDTPSQSWFTGAAVLSEAESGAQAGTTKHLTHGQPSSGWPIAWWVLLAAAAIALTEEALYHRRKVG